MEDEVKTQVCLQSTDNSLRTLSAATRKLLIAGLLKMDFLFLVLTKSFIFSTLVICVGISHNILEHREIFNWAGDR